MTEPEVTREAEALDRAIDDVRAGRGSDHPDGALVALLAEAHRPPLPADVRGRIGGRLEGLSRRPRVLWGIRLAAAALGGLFLVQGVPSLAGPAQLAEFLGLQSEPHIYQEVGILAIAMAAASIAAAVRPRLLAGVVAAVVPAGVALGIFGIFEIGHSPNPGAEMLHIAQALASGVLGLLWWRWRRDVPTAGAKE